MLTRLLEEAEGTVGIREAIVNARLVVGMTELDGDVQSVVVVSECLVVVSDRMVHTTESVQNLHLGVSATDKPSCP